MQDYGVMPPVQYGHWGGFWDAEGNYTDELGGYYNYQQKLYYAPNGNAYPIQSAQEQVREAMKQPIPGLRGTANKVDRVFQEGGSPKRTQREESRSQQKPPKRPRSINKDGQEVVSRPSSPQNMQCAISFAALELQERKDQFSAFNGKEEKTAYFASFLQEKKETVDGYIWEKQVYTTDALLHQIVFFLQETPNMYIRERTETQRGQQRQVKKIVFDIDYNNLLGLELGPTKGPFPRKLLVHLLDSLEKKHGLPSSKGRPLARRCENLFQELLKAKRTRRGYRFSEALESLLANLSAQLPLIKNKIANRTCFIKEEGQMRKVHFVQGGKYYFFQQDTRQTIVKDAYGMQYFLSKARDKKEFVIPRYDG